MFGLAGLSKRRPGTIQVTSRRGRVRRGFGVMCGVLLLAGCASGSTSTNPAEIKIGVVDPLSGSNASQGLDSLHGAELASYVINHGLPGASLPLGNTHGLPNLGGAKITIVSADTAGDATKGATAATKLVTDQHVVALSGAYQSGVTLAAAQQAERLGVPFVNGDSQANTLTQQGLRWFFRVGPTDLTFGESFFALLKTLAAKNIPVSKIGVLYSNDQYGNDGSAVTKQLASDNGATVVADVAFDPAGADLTSQVQQVRAARPDVLFVLAYTNGAQLLINAMKQLDYTPPVVMAYGGGFTDPNFIQSAGESLEGFSRRVSWSADLENRNPNAKAVADAFAKKYNAPLTENSARAFTAIMTLAQAINAAQSVESGKVLRQLTDLNIAGRDTIMPWDGVKFDGAHQNTGARGVVEQYLHGQWRVVYPENIASQPFVWPTTAARSGG